LVGGANAAQRPTEPPVAVRAHPYVQRYNSRRVLRLFDYLWAKLEN
jgi:hypothetical protein